ncbi:hypothetical protein [Bacteriovorax sp. DB6_IX]|uniref:hypothetical protein n=1 Tax=Bacteriovorax sp. DB6_IX TaxID=1353530 RepID=UPI00038A0ADF|nr:hypothetical protein [Bacteriovorax sp. DB6_IX]EQC52091.1 hypothetical protein M901_0747 [Bacteriovorax sp. DB6_IX]
MKFIRTAIIASLLSVTAIQSTQAAVGSMAFIVGMFGTAAKYALVGIGWTYAGHKANDLSPKIGKIALVTGLILLDEDTQTVEFNEVSNELAQKKGLTLAEAQAYNSEIEEINIIFSEVAGQINEETSEEEVRDLWQDHREFLSHEAFSALKKIVK